MESKRKSGILLHISSLPAKWGIGDFGKEAYRWIDHLVENGFSYWQILPLGPNGPGNSPYQAYSSYAGDPLFIAPDELVKWNLLTENDLLDAPIFSKDSVDYTKVGTWKITLIEKAWKNFQLVIDKQYENEFHLFLKEHNWWLNDYSLYRSCKRLFDRSPWTEWPEDLKKRNPCELEKYSMKLSQEIEFEKFTQFLFFRQWFRLKHYANSKGIDIFGDLPLYVSLDSADVWGNQELFLLNEIGNPTVVGGVPPDYFSEDGQLWGNPLFNWEKLAETNYQWWIARLYFHFHMFDLVRIDHFRGLVSFWAISADSETAKVGEWLPAKGSELLEIMQSRLGELPIVAEDLGIITPEVDALRNRFKLYGMRILQFAFESGSENKHLPHNFHGKCMVYTGTHDNDTSLGWWKAQRPQIKQKVLNYLPAGRKSIIKRMLQIVWASTATIAIVPLQDILELDSSARMNTPGTSDGNWRWRVTTKQLKKENFDFMKKLNIIYNRYNG